MRWMKFPSESRKPAIHNSISGVRCTTCGSRSKLTPCAAMAAQAALMSGVW